jgi:hypothetical protein
MLFEPIWARYSQCWGGMPQQLPVEMFDAEPQSGRFSARFD